MRLLSTQKPGYLGSGIYIKAQCRTLILQLRSYVCDTHPSSHTHSDTYPPPHTHTVTHTVHVTRNWNFSRFVQSAVHVCAVCRVAVNVNWFWQAAFWSTETSIRERNKQTTHLRTWDSAHQWLRANDEWPITSLLHAHKHCNYTPWINRHTHNHQKSSSNVLTMYIQSQAFSGSAAAVVLLFTSSTAFRISLSAFSCVSSLCSGKCCIQEVKMAFSFSWSYAVFSCFHGICCRLFPSVYKSLLPAEQPGFPSSDNFAAQKSKTLFRIA